MRLRISFIKVRKFFLAFLVLIGVFAGGYFLGVKGYKAEVKEAFNVKISRETPPDKNVDMSLFWQVWDTLSAKYFDKGKLVPADMVYGAISGMVSAVGDPYTMFLSPRDNKVVDEDLNGSFEGVGIEIGFRATRLAVISPLDDSPALEAGVKAGDYIVRIQDEEKGIDLGTQGITLPEAVKAIRGPAGSVVTLTLAREGETEPIVAEITRAKLNVPSIRLSYVGENGEVALIKVSKFGAETKGEWDEAVSQILQKPAVRGVIVDVRNNPGGYLQAAIDLAGDFVSTGTTVVVQENGNGTKEEFKSRSLPRLSRFKAVVLINGGSASASEILSGALRDDMKIQLVGEKSFGKGTIQEPVEITGGSGLHVTTAKWLTPNGTWVHETGLEPDVTISDDESTDEDEQLQSAIDLTK